MLLATCLSHKHTATPSTDQYCDGSHPPQLLDITDQSFSTHASGTQLQRAFLMLAVAVGFHGASRWRSAKRAKFVLIVRRGRLLRLFCIDTCAILLVWLLLSCGDIEANPGPVRYTPWTQAQNQHKNRQGRDHTAGYHFDQDRSTFEIPSNVHKSLFAMAGYPKEKMGESTTQLSESVQHLTEKCSQLENKFEQFISWLNAFGGSCQSADDNIDRLEAFSRQNNIKFFNVHEEDFESYTISARKVVQLLNRFYPCKTWSLDDVDRAHRLGQRRGSSAYPRPLIARLHRWSDKMTVLNDRDARQDMARTLQVRVAGDLTSRQQAIIRRERGEGRHAFFRNGRLHVDQSTGRQSAVHSETRHRTRSHGRVYHRYGRRRSGDSQGSTLGQRDEARGVSADIIRSHSRPSPTRCRTSSLISSRASSLGDRDHLPANPVRPPSPSGHPYPMSSPPTPAPPSASPNVLLPPPTSIGGNQSDVSNPDPTRPVPSSIHPPSPYSMHDFPTLRRTSTPRNNGTRRRRHGRKRGQSSQSSQCKDNGNEPTASRTSCGTALDDSQTFVKQRLTVANVPADVESQAGDLKGTDTMVHKSVQEGEHPQLTPLQDRPPSSSGHPDRMSPPLTPNPPSAPPNALHPPLSSIGDSQLDENPQPSPPQVSFINETTTHSGPRTRSRIRTRQLQLTESFTRAAPRKTTGRVCNQTDSQLAPPCPVTGADT